MKLSHSKLNTLVVNPKKYKAKYKVGLTPKVKSSTLTIGSAVHWGIENNTFNLDGFFKEGSFIQAQDYTFEQLLSESMVYGYLLNKEKIIDKLLIDKETNEKAEIIENQNELKIEAKLNNHDFVGIIDNLILTNKGFIIIDYKTSSKTPNWVDYLEQIYRYMYLLSQEFPEIPLYKTAIINIRKASIRQKNKESEFAFVTRLRMEYELNDDAYIVCHEYEPHQIDKKLYDRYIDNLVIMANFAEHVDKNKLYWWNYGDNFYGKNEYYDICHQIKDSWEMFNISDTIYDNLEDMIVTKRDAREIDSLAINNDDVLNKYNTFERELVVFYIVNKFIEQQSLFKYLEEKYIIDPYLFELYWLTALKKLDNIITKDNIDNIEVEDEE
jgi:hypothetical protein